MSSQDQPPRSEGQATDAAQHARRTSRRLPSLPPWRLAAVGVFVVAGALFVTSGHAAGGLDLRASSVTDLDTVVRQQAERADALQDRVAELGREVEALGESVDDARVAELQAQVAELRGPAGFEAVRGPAVTVTLTDAPEEERDRAEEEGDLSKQLVVHQQDIQAVVNALWLGGAEAMTLQKQRVISTTGIKCVGNTVVLNGRQFAPPYVITAIGDTDGLLAALASSDYIAGYLTYVAAFDLGYEVKVEEDEVTMPPYEGSTDLRYATAEAETGVDRD